ncbi:MAG: outer rane efflux protein [Caulobacteraceae bacterium]|nr:outer rane efflux protein [Caulobacteraceae bacterium]
MRSLNGALSSDLLAAYLLAACLGGCATSALDMAPERPDRPWSPVTTAGGEIVAGTRSSASPARDYVLPANSAMAEAPPGPSVDSAKIYGLADLIDLAESSNPTTRIAWNDARIAALAAGVVKSAYLPKVTATAVGVYGSSTGSASAQVLSVNSDHSGEGVISAVSLQWLLFDFGERTAVVDAAKQASVMSNIAFTASHQQLIYAVTQAFYANAAAQAHVATATESFADAQAVQTAAEDRYKRGVGTVIEVAQARQATAQAKLALVQAGGGAQDAYLSLLDAMGISPLTRIKVADVSGRVLSPAMDEPAEAVVSQALSRRPDVLGAYAAEKASQARVRAARAEFMPKVFLSATGAYNSGRVDLTALPGFGQQGSTVNLNGDRFGGTIVAGVTVPLYDGGTRAAALAQARAEADSAEARLARARQDAVMQVVHAGNALRTSLAAYSASQALATAAKTTFDGALGAYRNGVGPITDVTVAEIQLLQAKNAATDAYSTALSAAATLALVTGALGSAPQS